MGKHAAQSSVVQEMENDVRKGLKSPFVKRLAEQIAVAFVAGFGGVAFASGGNLTTALISGGVTAGLRAAYGVLVKDVGASADTPSVT